ncbi:MAG: tetratricopeptide repeat protein [Chloroflexota bacterium]
MPAEPVPDFHLPDQAFIRAAFAEKARRAGGWALEFTQAHANQTHQVMYKASSLLQALSSTIVYGGDLPLALQLALQLNPHMQSAGLWAEWEPYLEKALELARANERQPDEFHLLLALGDARALRGEWQAALPYLQAAMRLEATGGSDWLLPFTRYAECLLSLGRPPEAESILQNTMQKAIQHSDAHAQMILLGQLARLAQPRGDWAQAAAQHEEALRLARQLSDANQVLSNLNFLGVVYRELGQMQRALACLSEALKLCQQFNNRSGVGVVLVNTGRVHLASGDLPQAQTDLQAALGVHRSLGNRPKLLQALLSLGELYTQLGHFEQAQEYLDEASQIADLSANPLLQAHTLLALGHLQRARGETHNARQTYHRCQVLYLELGQTYLASQAIQRLQQLNEDSPP